jgi:hypothetical protein
MRVRYASKTLLVLRQCDVLVVGGSIAGIAAAIAARQGCLPRELPVHTLQQRLIDIGLLPEEVLMRKLQLRSLTPYQGAMAEAAYLIYSLGMARDPRSLSIWREVAARLSFTLQDFKHPFKSIFNYVDAICYGAERLGDPAVLPTLEQLHSQPLLHGQVLKSGFQEDYMLERLATLELAIARAMAR